MTILSRLLRRGREAKPVEAECKPFEARGGGLSIWSTDEMLAVHCHSYNIDDPKEAEAIGRGHVDVSYDWLEGTPFVRVGVGRHQVEYLTGSPHVVYKSVSMTVELEDAKRLHETLGRLIEGMET